MSNPPRFYYNFMGTKADADKVYYSSIPETDLSLSSARRPARMLDFTGLLPRSQNWAVGGQVAGQERPISVSPIQARYPPGHLKRRAEEPARMVGAGHIPSMFQGAKDPMHVGFGSGQFGPPGSALGRALGVTLGPRGVSGETGGITEASNLRGKKPKYPTPESDEDSVVIIPRPAMPMGGMPRLQPQGDGTGDQVVVRGFVRSRADESDDRVRIVCLCHGRTHSAEDFVNHCGAPVSATDPKCFITVTRGR